jgi:anti-sigma factor RsiW
MNATSTQPDPNERAELARLVPGPVERDLPSDRHQRLQEFVMRQIHQDLRSAEQAPRRSPKRRPVLLASGLAAVATAAAVVISTGGSGGSAGSGDGSVTQVAASLSGRQILLAAATTAERTPAGSGAYWYVKTTYQ